MVVEWSVRASADMRELKAYIAQDSPHYARRFVEKIIKAVESLTNHPRIGRRVPEANREDVREVIFQSYRVIYKIEPERIHIVTVLHGGRDLAGSATKPWEIG